MRISVTDQSRSQAMVALPSDELLLLQAAIAGRYALLGYPAMLVEIEAVVIVV